MRQALLFLFLVACANESGFGGDSGTKKNPPKPATKSKDADKAPEPTPKKTKTPPERDDADSAPETLGKADDAPATPTAPAVKDDTPPPPDGSVTKGSFTAWTEPKTPAAFQDYRIFIKVTLPPNTPPLARSDLSGEVRGTDLYVQPIGDSFADQDFQSNAASALLVIPVPGSFSNVHDTIAIRSAALNENQTLELTFQ